VSVPMNKLSPAALLSYTRHHARCSTFGTTRTGMPNWPPSPSWASHLLVFREVPVNSSDHSSLQLHIQHRLGVG
jgi:hypothetical protein